MITAAAAAAVVSCGYTLAVAVEDPNATDTEKSSPENSANGVRVDDITEGLGVTATYPTTPRFANHCGDIISQYFRAFQKQQQWSLPEGRNPLQQFQTRSRKKREEDSGVISDRTTTATATAMKKFHPPPADPWDPWVRSKPVSVNRRSYTGRSVGGRRFNFPNWAYSQLKSGEGR